MSEDFDTELARAIKESAVMSLGGWEFTPEMQRSVLERVERAAAGTVPAASPSRRFNPGRGIRPLVWTVVAAATFMVVLNSRVGERSLDPRSAAPAEQRTANAPVTDAPVTDAAQADKAQQAAPVPPASGQGEGGREGAAAKEAQSGSSAAPPGASQPNMAVVPPPSADQVAESQNPPQTKQPEQPAQPAAPTDLKALPTVPEPSGIASLPAETDGGAGPAVRSAFSPGTVALQVPPPDAKVEQTPPVGLMAVAGDKLHVQAVGARVVELSRSAVRSLGPDGAEAWVYPLAGATEESLLAVAEDGSVAVALANKVHVLTPEGKLLRTLEPAGDATALAWGPGSRLAMAAGANVTVLRPATVTAAFYTEAIGEPELSFGPDGTLAVFGDGTSGRELLLYDKDGALMKRLRQGRAKARGLAFFPGGVLAGSQAYALPDRPLWQAPFAPEGVTSLTGTELVVARKADTVAVLRVAGGVPVWQATWSGAGQGLQRVVAAPDGCFLAVLGATDDGWVLWILDQHGKVLHAERLPDAPSDMAFVGDRLMLLTPRGAEFRAFPQ